MEYKLCYVKGNKAWFTDNMENEIWKDVPDYEGLYQVSNLGRIRNSKGRILNFCKDKDGYLKGNIYKNGKNKNIRLHRLIAEAFILNPNNYPSVNHKDENKSNNSVDNLEWCTNAYNTRYSKAKKVLQYDLNDNLIKKWDSVRDIVRALGFNLECITGCCNGKYKTSHGYKWRYTNG